jgi:predicted lipid-binding transport protein (Tim44 family)
VNRLLVFALAAFASLAIVHVDFADAARMGGGRSFGMQRSITPSAPRTAPSTPSTPSAGNSFNGPAANPVMPARPGATATNPAAPAAGAAGAAAASRSSRWLGPIAGLAAGLGLAALFSHLGLSEGLGSLLLIGLLVVGAVALLRLFMARRAQPAAQYAGAARAPIDVREPALPANWGSASDTPAGRYPQGFDPAPFVAQATQQFRRVQDAYDRGDRALLADVTTPEMHAEIIRDLASRGSHVATEVATLDADVLEVVREGDQYVASVRFFGTIREDGAREPQPFEETWHLVKPVDGSSGWLLAGIQQKDARAVA